MGAVKQEKQLSVRKEKHRKWSGESVKFFQLSLGINNMVFKNNKSKTWRLYTEIRKSC